MSELGFGTTGLAEPSVTLSHPMKLAAPPKTTDSAVPLNDTPSGCQTQYLGPLEQSGVSEVLTVKLANSVPVPFSPE